MADYISRAEFMGKITAAEMQKSVREKSGSDAYFSFLEIINGMPAADVVEVVHGRWQRIGIFKKDGPIYPCCSVCGIVSAAYKSQWEGLQGPWKYCPECGAKMDGKEE